MATRIFIAKTKEEKELAYRLRYLVYVVEERRFNPSDFPDGRILDDFDDDEYSKTALLFDSEVLIGTVRVSLESPIGFPADRLFDFRNQRKELTGPFGTVGMLAVLKEFRSYENFISLYRFGVYWFFKAGVEWAFYPLNHEIKALFIRLGAEPVSEIFYSEHVRNFIVPMRQNAIVATEKLVELKFYRSLGDLDTFERLTYRVNEKVFSQGDETKNIYYITRGTANVYFENPVGSSILTDEPMLPGEIIGEIGAITGMPRSASIVAGPSGLELVPISSNVIFDFANSPGFNMLIMKNMAKRLYLNGKSFLRAANICSVYPPIASNFK